MKSRNEGALSRSFVQQVAPKMSPQVRQVQSLSRRRGWNCAVLGQAPLPTRPVRVGDWLMVPVEQDSSPVPDRALRRVQDVFAAGIRPKGFVVVHEAPKLLSGPSEERSESLRMGALPEQLRSKLKTVAAGMGTLGLALVAIPGLAVLAVAALALAAMVMVPVLLIAGAVIVDPILVAVTEDGYWVEIDRWWSEGSTRGDSDGADLATL
jgi:hypothetical protein